MDVRRWLGSWANPGHVAVAVLGAALIVAGCGGGSDVGAADGSHPSDAAGSARAVDDGTSSAEGSVPDPAGTVGPVEWFVVAAAPDGRRLFLVATFGGVASDCSRWEGWDAEESSDSVEIRAMVWQRDQPAACTDDGAMRSLEVTLDAPLDDRDLVGCTRDDCTTVGGPEWLHGDVDVRTAAVSGGVVVMDTEVVAMTHADGTPGWERPRSGWQLAVGREVVALGSAGGTTAVDAGTGGVVWEHDGVPVGTMDDRVVVCGGGSGEEVELEGDGGTLMAREADTGALVWETESPCSPLARAGDSLVVLTPDPEVDGGVQLVVVAADTGDRLARRTIDDGLDDRVDGFGPMVTGGPVAVLGGFQADLVVLDERGDEQARYPQVRGIVLGVDAGVAVLASEAGVVGVDLATGRQVWQRPDLGRGDVAVAGDLVIARPEPDADVEGLELATGQQRWTAALDRAIGLAAARDPSTGALYVATSLSVSRIDPETGQVAWWQPSAMNVTDRLDLTEAS